MSTTLHHPFGKQRLRADSRTLRIGLVSPLWARVGPGTYGGVESIVHLLTEELVKRGHDVTLFASGDSQTTSKLRAVYQNNLMDAMERGFAHEYEYYAECNLAEALRESDSFDVIHFHLGCAPIPLGTLSKAPVLHTMHMPITPDAQWVLERYPQAAVTAVAHHQIAGIPEECRRNLRVIYNGCDFDSYEFSATPGKYLVFLGRISPRKSPLDAIFIAKQAGLPILLAGKPLDGEEERYFKEKIQPMIDGINVIYIGPVNHSGKVDLLKKASALVFPVQWPEPFGMVMIEAMACGVPVLALNNGAVSEVVDLGKTGFHAQTIEELVSLVPKTLMLDRKEVRDQSMARFSHKRMADEYLEAYRALIDATDTSSN